jgi:hypothetical protein
MDDWIGALEKAIRMAQEAGHIRNDVDPSQLAFELNALFFGANFSFYLRNDEHAIERARKAVEARLDMMRTNGN